MMTRADSRALDPRPEPGRRVPRVLDGYGPASSEEGGRARDTSGYGSQGKPLLVVFLIPTWRISCSARRAPGYYRFVAVDHDGQELQDLPVINQQLVVKPLTPVALSQNLKAQVLDAILAGSQKHPDVAAALEQAGGEDGARILIVGSSWHRSAAPRAGTG